MMKSNSTPESRPEHMLDHLSSVVRRLIGPKKFKSASSTDGDEADTQEIDLTLDALNSQFNALTLQVESGQTRAQASINQVLERIQEGYFVLDAEGRYLAINPAAQEQIFRRPAAEMLGKSFEEAFPEPAMAEFARQFHLLVSLGEPVKFETFSAASRTWLEICGYPGEGQYEFYVRDRSEHKQFESRLLSVARFPGENPNPVLRIDQHGSIRYANPASRELLDCYHCEVDGPAPEMLRGWALAALHSGQKMTADLPVNERYYTFVVVPVPSQQYTNLYGSDITERKQAEDELMRSHRQFERVLSSITEGYFVLDQQWRVVDFNHVAEREFLRRPRAELLGKVFWEEFPQAVGNEYYQQYHKAFATGQPVHFEALSGLVPMWYEVHAYPLDGRLEIYLHNIDQRKRAEQERERLLAENRRQKDLLEAVLQQMPAGVMIANAPDGQVLMGNRQIEEIWQQDTLRAGTRLEEGGYTGKHPNGQPYQPDEWPLMRSIRLGEVVRGEEIHFTRPTGEPVVISVNSAPIYNAAHQIEAGVVVFFDVTARKRAEQNNQFLASFSERLLELFDPLEVKRYASEAIGSYLGVERCIFDEIRLNENTVLIEGDYARGATSLAGRYPLDEFQEKMVALFKNNRQLVAEDTRLHPITAPDYAEVYQPTGLRSLVVIPRVKDGARVSAMVVAAAEPRAWSADELALLRSASDLVWLSLEGASLMRDLRELSERFNVALKNAPVSVFMLNRELRFTWVYNPLFGLSEQEMIGKRDDEIFPPDEVTELVELKRKVLATNTGKRKELRLSREGIERIYDITIEPLHGLENEVVGLTVAWIDITGQRQLEAEMRERSAQIEIQRQILRHRELERMEVARDLHDGPLQEMIGMEFALGEIELAESAEERRTVLEQLQASLHRQISDVRAFCYELRPPALTPFGLERAIRSHIENHFRDNKQITFHLDLMRDGKTLPEEIRLALYRVYQEALNNIQRHARASEVWLRFAYDNRQIELEIRDNGQGFKVPYQWVKLAREGHLGVVGMHERVHAIGGKIEVDSAPGQGTHIVVRVPRDPEE